MFLVKTCPESLGFSIVSVGEYILLFFSFGEIGLAQEPLWVLLFQFLFFKGRQNSFF